MMLQAPFRHLLNTAQARRWYKKRSATLIGQLQWPHHLPLSGHNDIHQQQILDYLVEHHLAAPVFDYRALAVLFLMPRSI